MWIRAIEIENFGPFAGEHRLELEPVIYAVRARLADNPERSNWLGKSSFLNAVRWGLYGQHAWDGADGCITHGEPNVRVKLGLVDGAVVYTVTRTRKRGKSTQLNVDGPGIDANQAQAQDTLDRILGMDHSTFITGPFVRQKCIAELVTADPSRRTAIFNEWLDMEPIQRAEDHARSTLADVRKEHDRATALLDVAREQLAAADVPGEQCASCEQELAAKQSELNTLTEQLQAARAGRDTRRLLERDVQRLAAIREAGKAAAKMAGREVDAKHAEAIEKIVEQLTEEFTAARMEYARLLELTSDGFDGHCPVSKKPCPAVDHVTAELRWAHDSKEQLEFIADESQRKLEDAKGELRAVQREAREVEDAHRELVRLRKQGRELLASEKQLAKLPAVTDDDPAVLGRIDELRAECRELQGRIADAKSHKQRVAALREGIVTNEATLKALDTKLKVAQRACAILGRNGIQRDIAQEAMGTIESRANALLKAAAIELAITVQWARVGKGLATHCDGCGAPFPRGASAKECAACGLPRGPKTVDKVHFALSNRSGAADDIAGLAFTLAAASWRRERTGGALAVTLIDEPFSACDAANAKAMGIHLQAIIRGDGWEQGMLVAHDDRVMDAMPAAIVVTSDGQRASLAVE